MPQVLFMHSCEMSCSTSDTDSTLSIASPCEDTDSTLPIATPCDDTESTLPIATPCEDSECTLPIAPPCKEALAKYPYVFRRTYHCGRTDEFIEVTRLHSQDHVTHTVIAPPGDVKSVPTYSLKRCRSCAEQIKNNDQKIEEQSDIKRRLRSVAAYQGEMLCVEPGAVRVKDGFERALQQLAKKNDGTEHKTVHGPHEFDSKTLVQAPDASLYKRAMKIVNDFLDKRNFKTAETGQAYSEPHLRGGGAKELRISIAEDARGTVRGRVLGHVRPRSFETNVRRRHSAAYPTPQRKPEKTYVKASARPRGNNESQEKLSMYEALGMSDTQVQLGANMVDLKSDLEWLDPIASFNRDFDASENLLFAEIMEAPLRIQEEPVALKGEDPVCSVESPPELDEGYQTSDSGLSIADELIAQYLAPLHDVLGKLPMDIDSRFESGSSNAMYEPEECISRFSWDSSNDSESIRDPSEAWWKPKPLNIRRKSLQSAPPIPTRNPLRLLRRISKSAPKGFSEASRGTRNVRQLQLDLARTDMVERRRSFRSPRSIRRQSYARAIENASWTTSLGVLPDLTPTGHIATAMRKPTRSLETKIALRKIGDAARVRRDLRNSALAKVASKNHSTIDLIRPNEFSEMLEDARGHARGASEPLGSGIRRSNTSSTSKWNESMPAHGSVRRSCIASITNEVEPRRSALPLDINKRLPPLPQ